MAATRGPQNILEGYARSVARGGAGRTMRDNIAAMDALITAGLVADGTTVDGSSRNGGKAYDTVIAQFPDEPLNAWEVPAPLLNIHLGFGTQIWDNTAANPVPPGWGFSVIYGPSSARDIFAKTLNVPPRNTFNVLEAVLTLPATVTDNLTYHTAICAFVDQFSSGGVAYGIGAHCVAEASNSTLGGFGNLCVDSPLMNGAFTNVRMQNEYDWYTGNAGTSIRATLHDGYFLAPPNSPLSLVAFSNNLFTGPLAIGTAYYNGSVMTIVGTPSFGTFRSGMRIEGTGIDGTQNILMTFGTGTGGAGTYNLVDINNNPVNVGVIGSVGSPVTVRGSMSYQWNIGFQSPDGVNQVAIDIGQRNVANSNTIGGRSQITQFRFSDTTLLNERIMQQWIEPMASGGVFYLQNFASNTPASFGVQNFSLSSAAYLAQNRANTGWIDMLHLDGFDRTVLGAGSAQTYFSTTAGVAVEILDDGVATTSAIAIKAGTAAQPARIYAPGLGNLQFAYTGLSTPSTSGFTSPFPVMVGTPTGVPTQVSAINAWCTYNTASKTLNIFDPTANGWYHVALTAGAA